MVDKEVIVAWDRRVLKIDSAFRYLRKLLKTEKVDSNQCKLDFGEFYELRINEERLYKALRVEQQERNKVIVYFCDESKFNRAVGDESGARNVGENVYVFIKDSKGNRSSEFSEYEEYCGGRGIDPYEPAQNSPIRLDKKKQPIKPLVLQSPSPPPSKEFLNQVADYFQPKLARHLELLQKEVTKKLESFHSRPRSTEQQGLAAEMGRKSADLISQKAGLCHDTLQVSIQKIQEETTGKLEEIRAIEAIVSNQMKKLDSEKIRKEVEAMNAELEELKGMSDISQVRSAVELLEAQETWLSEVIDNLQPPWVFPIKLVLANLAGNLCILIQYKTFQDGQIPLKVWLQTTPEKQLTEDNILYLNKDVMIFPFTLYESDDFSVSVLDMDGVRLVKNDLKISVGQLGEALEWNVDVESFYAEQKDCQAKWLSQ